MKRTKLTLENLLSEDTEISSEFDLALRTKVLEHVSESFKGITSETLEEKESIKYDSIELTEKMAIDYVVENSEEDFSNLDAIIIESARKFDINVSDLEQIIIEDINAQRNKLIRKASQITARGNVSELRKEIQKIMQVRKETGNTAYGRGQEEILRKKIFDGRKNAYGKTKSQGQDNIPTGVKI